MSSKKKVMPTGSILIDVVEGLSKLQTHGTGEVEDKPEMPERIWAQVEHYEGRGYYYPDKMGNDCFLYLSADKVRELARFAEACWQQLDGLLARGSSDIDYDDEIKMRDEKLDWRESLGLLDALFPEGVEEK